MLDPISSVFYMASLVILVETIIDGLNAKKISKSVCFLILTTLALLTGMFYSLYTPSGIFFADKTLVSFEGDQVTEHLFFGILFVDEKDYTYLESEVLEIKEERFYIPNGDDQNMYSFVVEGTFWIDNVEKFYQDSTHRIQQNSTDALKKLCTPMLRQFTTLEAGPYNSPKLLSNLFYMGWGKHLEKIGVGFSIISTSRPFGRAVLKHGD